jgi:hypothetical protein
MIDASMIPDEVVEALCNHVGPVMTRADWRAALAAALAAWPGMQHDNTHNKRTGYIILPLPKEGADE